MQFLLFSFIWYFYVCSNVCKWFKYWYAVCTAYFVLWKSRHIFMFRVIKFEGKGNARNCSNHQVNVSKDERENIKESRVVPINKWPRVNVASANCTKQSAFNSVECFDWAPVETRFVISILLSDCERQNEIHQWECLSIGSSWIYWRHSFLIRFASFYH